MEGQPSSQTSHRQWRSAGRQTWLLKEFGKRHFNNVAYASLDVDTAACALFEDSIEPSKILKGLSLLLGQPIEPGSTLVVLDEIQSQPKAITSLKYFCEDAPEYAIAAAGSFLGLCAHFGSGYPVGKVNTLDLYPLSFEEFLDATGNRAYREVLESGDTSLMGTLRSKYEPLLKQYYVVGGMPGVVEEYVETEDLVSARVVQSHILTGYMRDFAKHAPARLYPRTLEAWESILQHLSHENKKFVFGAVRKGARAKDYEEVLVWLSEAGLIRKVPRVTKPGIPLTAYNDNKSFKVFLNDVGLLGAMAELDPRSIVDGNAVFTEFKGALTEQFVCQQLVCRCGATPYYWSAENSTGEIDLLVQHANGVYAIEVKAEENLRSKSLRVFKERYPEVCAVRFSLSDYREQDWMRNVPLYALGTMELWGQTAV